MTGTGRPRRIWITRTRPGGDATAKQLFGMGLTPIVAPVLAARPIADVTLDLTGVDAVAFTSGHAVAAFAGLSDFRTPQAFAVGEATAEAARRIGFSSVVVGRSGAHALAHVIAAVEPRPAKVFIPNAAEPTADLVALLADLGVMAVQAAVYETVPTNAFVPLSEIDALLVHSARAAALVADHLAGRPETSRLVVYAISEAAAAPLRAVGLTAVKVAALPSELALLSLLT